MTLGKSPRDEPDRPGQAGTPAGTSDESGTTAATGDPGAASVGPPRTPEPTDTPAQAAAGGVQGSAGAPVGAPAAGAATGAGAAAGAAAGQQQGIGATLSSARRAANLTVEQVSSQTRVRVPIVRGIEADDFTRCGGDFYARGHIRAIARAVGVDGEALVARYDAEHGAPAATRPVPISFESERVQTDRRRPNWTIAMVAAIAVVVAVIGFNLVSGKHQTTAEVNPTNASPTAGTHPTTGRTLTPTPTANGGVPTPSGSAIAAVPTDKVTVKLVADSGTTWMSITGSSGNQLFQGDLGSGQSKTFTDDKRINLVLGNAAAVHLFVNGKDLGSPGSNGQVVRLAYTPGNPQAG